MKVIEGTFGKPSAETEEDLGPTVEEVCGTVLAVSEEVELDEITVVLRSSETGSLVVVSNQNLVDQNFMFDAAKQAMFSNILREED